MYKLFIIFILCVGTAFAQGPFYGYVKDFLILARVYNRPHATTFNIGFGDTTKVGKDVIGLCYQEDAKDPSIIILPSWWEQASDTSRMMLVSHELSHCILGRDHKLSLYLNHDPISIMYPVIFSDEVFNRHAKEYIEELFTNKDSFSDSWIQACNKEALWVGHPVAK